MKHVDGILFKAIDKHASDITNLCRYTALNDQIE